jgi:AcrR family transcriptional regulator
LKYINRMSKPDHAAETRQRLLEAAGEVFADRGYRAATIRDICERAKANVAAAHYHFGDKEELYLAVLKSCADEALRKFPPTLGLGESATAEQKLHAYVRSFLFRIADKGRPAWHGKLMAHEMAEPTEALDGLIDEVYRPLIECLEAIIRQLLGGNASDDVVRHCARSIQGQCLYYYFAQPIIQRMTPQQRFETDDIEQLAERITRFSLAGLKECRP